MLPPHPPFVQKVVRRRIVRRGPGQVLSEAATKVSDAASAGLKAIRRTERRLKPALKVLERPLQDAGR